MDIEAFDGVIDKFGGLRFDQVWQGDKQHLQAMPLPDGQQPLLLCRNAQQPVLALEGLPLRVDSQQGLDLGETPYLRVSDGQVQMRVPGGLSIRTGNSFVPALAVSEDGTVQIGSPERGGSLTIDGPLYTGGRDHGGITFGDRQPGHCAAEGGKHQWTWYSELGKHRLSWSSQEGDVLWIRAKGWRSGDHSEGEPFSRNLLHMDGDIALSGDVSIGGNAGLSELHAQLVESTSLQVESEIRVGGVARTSRLRAGKSMAESEARGATASFWRADTPHHSYIHYDNTGDWYINAANDGGSVYIQESCNGRTFIGGGRPSGPCLDLQNVLLFGASEDRSTIEIRKAADSNQFGTMVGHFNPPSSLAYKREVDRLEIPEVERLLDDTLRTDLFHFHYHADAADRERRLGVVTEACPSYIIGDEGRSLSLAAYTAMLHGAIKALARRLEALEPTEH